MPLPISEVAKLKMDDEERTRLGSVIIEQIRNARNAMGGMLEDIEFWRDLYEANLPEKSDPWEGCSNTNLPLIQSHVDSAHAQICSIIFGVEPWLLINVPDELASMPDIKKRSMNIENMLQSLLEKEMRWRVEGDMTLLETLLTPAAMLAVDWREEYRTVKRITQADDGHGGTVDTTEAQKVPIYRAPAVELVELDNFVVAPTNRTSVDRVVLIGHKLRLTHDELTRRVQSGEYDEVDVNKIVSGVTTEDTDSNDSHADGAQDRANVEATSTEYYKFWRVIRGYDSNNDKLLEDCVFVIHEDTGTIVSAREYHYWHGQRNYVKFTAYPRPKHFFGRAQPQLLEHCQCELNTIHNQRVDANTIRISPVLKKRRSALPNQDNNEWYPGAQLLVDEMGDLQEVQIDPMTPGIDIEQTVMSHAELADGVSANAQGAQPRGSNVKATGLNIAANQGSIRIADIVRRVQDSICAVAVQVLGLCYQFMPDEDLQRYQVPREDLVLPWEIDGHGNSTTANKTQRKEESLALYKLLADNPYVQRDPRRGWNVTRDLLLAFERTDTENYIGTETEMDEYAKEIQMQRSGQQQIAGAPPQGQPPQGPGIPNMPAQLQQMGDIPQLSPPGGVPGAGVEG